MPYYSSFEGPDPATAEPWRAYRRWKAARRRRRWAAVLAAIAVVTGGAAALWPDSVQHAPPRASEALARFEAPNRSDTVRVPPSAQARGIGDEASFPPAPPATALSPTRPAPPAPPEVAVAATPEPPPSETAGSASEPEAFPPATASDDIPGPEPAAMPIAETAPVPASKPASPRGSRLQLASFRSEANARRALEKLRRDQVDLLGPLETGIERTTLADGRQVFRVQAGPLPGPEAKRICAELQRRRLDCRFVR